MVFVHLDPLGSRLAEHDGKVICDAPCDVVVPRAKRYVIDARSRSDPFTLEAAGGRVVIRVQRELVWHTKAANILVASTVGGGLAIGLAGFALYEAANGFSSYCPGWPCTSDQATGRLVGVVLGVLGGAIAAGGLSVATVLYTVPSIRLNVRVARDKSATHARWVPDVGVTAHGASLGFHVAF